VLAGVSQGCGVDVARRACDGDEVTAFLRRWLLVTDARARQMLRFLS
jgi:hypothetical protein